MRKFKDGDKVYVTQHGCLVESEKYKGMIFTVVGEQQTIGEFNAVFLKELNKPYNCDELRLYTK